MAKQPSLAGQIDAFIRQGAKDLHNAVVPAFPTSLRGVEELGTPLNPTSQMVTQELDQEFAARAAQASRPAPAPDDVMRMGS